MNTKKNSSIFKKAFTLVEIIVVVAIMAIILQVVSMILVTIIRQQASIIRFSDVKKQGDQALARLKSEIYTNAYSVHAISDNSETCVAPVEGAIDMSVGSATNHRFKNSAGAYFKFYTDASGVLKFDDPTGVTQDITTSKVKLKNFKIQCIKPGNYSNKLISIEYDIESSTTLMKIEGNPSLHYSTKIRLKR